MGPPSVVKGHPIADHPPDLEAVGDFFEVFRPLLERPPEVFNEAVAYAPAATTH